MHNINHNYNQSNVFISQGYYRKVRPYRKKTFDASSSSDNFWCETCDRGFQTADLLKSHNLQHQKCNIDGCQFIAHPKVITKHIQMQHSSGLYKKIANINNPEEIRKWREERKKRYPTKVNIEKKAAELKEKIARGEKMDLKYQTHCKKQKSSGPQTIRNNKFYDKQNLRKKTTKINKKPTLFNKQSDLPTESNDKKLKPFTGLPDLMDVEIDEITDERDTHKNLIDDDDYFVEDLPKKTEVSDKNKEHLTVCGALSSLMCEYGSSDEDVEPETTSTKISNTMTNVKIKEDNESGPEETKIDKSTSNAITEEIKPKCLKREKGLQRNKTQQRQEIYGRRKPKLPSTLLHKLLSKEMKQERNIILQCVHHIVNSNYFSQ